MLRVIETFASIQGESTHAGRRCFFIRLAGCNLRCNYCDTAYAWDGGEEFSIEKLVTLAVNSKCDIVEVTGGEPLMQKDTPLLLQALLDEGFTVLLETNGSVSIAQVPEKVCKIVDCKTPGSAMAENNCFENFSRLKSHDEVKFVISGKEDFDWSVQIIQQYRLAEKTPNLVFSPVWGRVDFQELAKWVVESNLPIRMQLQMHKIIWGDKKGV